jgi:LAO/AO transport system kinase
LNQTELIENLKEGDVRAVAKLLTLIEDEDEKAERLLKKNWKLTGKSYIIGITGPPGAGKSTIVDVLAKIALKNGHKVGILAVDPTSPFSGGAVLGDRLRMSSAQESGIFIRSVASRGHLGGLASTTRFMINALELLQNDITLVETVGAGQGDVEVVQLADTTIVVEVPGLGDEVQAQKAGILEIGDILVVNKSDRAGADRLSKELQMMLSLGEHGEWLPPIVTTTATSNKGIDNLWNEIENHRNHLGKEKLQQERIRKLSYELRNLVSQKLFARKIIEVGKDEIENMAMRIMKRDIDPFSAVEKIIKE